MVVRKFAPGKEDDPEGVRESARDKEPYARRREFADDGGQNGNDEPAHDNVESGGGPVLTVFAHERFGEDAGDGKKPNHAEDGPAQRATDGDEGKWGVGAGD